MKKISDSLNNYERNDLDTKLMSGFLEAIKDGDFNDLVSILKLPYENLCKYTSNLEECKNEYSHCKKCKGLINCQNQIEGYAYLPNVSNSLLTFEYKACRYQKKKLKEKEHLKYINFYDVTKEVSSEMKNIYQDDENRYNAIETVTKFIKNYPKEKKGIYLCGSFGSGKTYILTAMLNELAKSKIKSSIVFWPEFLRDLKSSFNSDFSIKFDNIKKTPILLIDDIGAENTTTWSRDDILCPIIQYRMQMSLPTFFTSNLDLNSLEEHFSLTKDGADRVKAKRIIERIKQMTNYVEMISDNLRK